MKLKEVLNPEIVLGVRGDPNQIENYKRFTRLIHIQGNKTELRAVEEAELPFYDILNRDPIFREHMILAKMFRMKRPPLYMISKPFGTALMKLNRNVPIELFPKRFFAYFHFAPGTISDSDGEIEGAYVYIAPMNELPIQLSLRNETMTEFDPVIFASAVSKNLSSVSKLVMPLSTKKIDDIYVEEPHYELYDMKKGVSEILRAEQSEDFVQHRSLFRLILNSILYLHSKDPEINKLKPMSTLSHRQRREARKTNFPQNLCEIPLSLLNWSYHGRVYQADSTYVETFPRWQRVGPQLSQVKLVWVKEHERRYKTNAETSPTDLSPAPEHQSTDSHHTSESKL